ncbi:MAG: hypothetical protein IPF99_40915 [Deltaproteobacteria bacterium]|nr:hypothetical protein [Deltaproteobacteria bacterium]
MRRDPPGDHRQPHVDPGVGGEGPSEQVEEGEVDAQSSRRALLQGLRGGRGRLGVGGRVEAFERDGERRAVQPVEGEAVGAVAQGRDAELIAAPGARRVDDLDARG